MALKMAKEPGLNNFKTLGPKPTDVLKLAEQYLETETSLRESIKTSLDENRDVSKLERDLSTFYDTICNKFGISIKSHDEFLDFIESLKNYQSIMDDAKEKVANAEDRNLSIISKSEQSNTDKTQTSLDLEPVISSDPHTKEKWDMSKDFEIISKSDKNKKWFPKKGNWTDDTAPTKESKALDATYNKSEEVSNKGSFSKNKKGRDTLYKEDSDSNENDETSAKNNYDSELDGADE